MDRARLQGLIGAFDAAIVLGPAPRGMERRDAVATEELLEVRGAEGRAVVDLEDQRRTVFGEQPVERRDRGRRGLISDRRPGELLAAGQIADGDQVAAAAVDQVGRFGEVERPDGVGPRPLQTMALPSEATPTEGAEAAREGFDLDAAHVRELAPQRGDAGGRPGLS